MTLKPLAFLLPLAGFVLGAPPAYPAAAAPATECTPADHIDRSTAAEARRKIAAAGYTGVHDLKKGCDNFWHGKALHNGAETRVVLAPDGAVHPEGD